MEPSFIELIAAVERAQDLSEQRRRHWICSLRQIAKLLDRPSTVIPARSSAVRISVGHLHHARLSVTAKTLANHKANVSAALRWFDKGHTVMQHGVRLSAKWVKFCDGLDKPIRLYNLMRYCSARRIDPASLDDTIFDEYWRYRTQTTARASNDTARRFMISSMECLCNSLAAAAAYRATNQGHRARLGRFP